MFRLYRAVSADELADIVAVNGFRPGPNSLLGKWFAETPEAAQQWGRLLYPNPGEVFQVIGVDVPINVADQMFCLPSLDQVGTARYADENVLTLINQQHSGLVAMP